MSAPTWLAWPALAWAAGGQGVALSIPWEVVQLFVAAVVGALGGGGLVHRVAPGQNGRTATTDTADGADALLKRVVGLETRVAALESGLLAGLADVRGRLEELEDESGLRDETSKLRAAIERLERSIGP